MTDIAHHQMAYQNIHNNLHPFFQYTIPPPPPPPPPPLSLHASSDSTSFPILAISIVGMLTTAILLLSYYVFVIKCCLHSDILLRLSRSRRQHHLIDDRLRSVNYSGASGEGNGLDESTIQAIRTLRFRNTNSSTPFRDCAVCLNEFQEEEKIRMLPNCYHVFHIDCIDTWLQNHSNCPLCRADITTHSVLATAQPPNFDWGESTAGVIQIVVVDDHGRSDREADEQSYRNATTSDNYVMSKERKMNMQHYYKVTSMGDECIDLRGKDMKEEFNVQAMRRSFSMDSSCDRQLYMAVQEILQQNPHFRGVKTSSTREGSSSNGSGRIRRSFFSFSRSSKSSSVLPIQVADT